MNTHIFNWNKMTYYIYEGLELMTTEQSYWKHAIKQKNYMKKMYEMKLRVRFNCTSRMAQGKQAGSVERN